MRIENLSDSETARDTYEKDVDDFPQKSLLNTATPQTKVDNPKNVLDLTTTVDRPLD